MAILTMVPMRLLRLSSSQTQIVNEHVLGYVAGQAISQSEGLVASSCGAESTATGGACAPADFGHVPGRERRGTSVVDTVPGYVMKVFPHDWVMREDALGQIRRLDDEPPDEDENDEEGDDPEDNRTKSGAALFRSECQPELEPDQPNWAYQSAFVQFTQEGVRNDPFDDFSLLDEDVEMLDEDGEMRFVVDDDDDNRKRALCQIRSYADNISLYQHRTAVFSLVVMGRTFRIVRWDPSGVFVSEKADYSRDTRALVEVLLAFVIADSEAQGYDPTATLLPKVSEDYERMDRVVDEICCRLPVLPWAEGTPLPPTIPVQTYATFPPGVSSPADAMDFLFDDADYQPPLCSADDGPGPPTETTWTATATTRRVLRDDSFVFQYVLDSFRDSLTCGFLRYRLKVGSDEFLVAAPLFHDCRYGGARGYVAFHKQSGKLVFLKDSWRPHYPSPARLEGDILHMLNEDEVRNVPTLLCHGIVDGQVTRVLDHWMDSNKSRAEERRGAGDIDKNAAASESESEPRGVKRTREDLEEATPHVRHYVHYRIAVTEVCLPLTAFTSSRQLVRVVGDTIQGMSPLRISSLVVDQQLSCSLSALRCNGEVGHCAPRGQQREHRHPSRLCRARRRRRPHPARGMAWNPRRLGVREFHSCTQGAPVY